MCLCCKCYRTLQMRSTSRLHQILADTLAKKGDDEGAANHYSIALNLDPRLAAAREGLRRVERGPDGGGDGGSGAAADPGSYGAESAVAPAVAPVAGGPVGGVSDESETEAVWSDGDLNLAPTGNSSSRYL